MAAKTNGEQNLLIKRVVIRSFLENSYASHFSKIVDSEIFFDIKASILIGGFVKVCKEGKLFAFKVGIFEELYDVRAHETNGTNFSQVDIIVCKGTFFGYTYGIYDRGVFYVTDFIFGSHVYLFSSNSVIYHEKVHRSIG